MRLDADVVLLGTLNFDQVVAAEVSVHPFVDRIGGSNRRRKLP